MKVSVNIWLTSSSILASNTAATMENVADFCEPQDSQFEQKDL